MSIYWGCSGIASFPLLYLFYRVLQYVSETLSMMGPMQIFNVVRNIPLGLAIARARPKSVQNLHWCNINETVALDCCFPIIFLLGQMNKWVIHPGTWAQDNMVNDPGSNLGQNNSSNVYQTLLLHCIGRCLVVVQSFCSLTLGPVICCLIRYLPC